MQLVHFLGKQTENAKGLEVEAIWDLRVLRENEEERIKGSVSWKL